MRILQRQQVGERDQRPHSLHLFQPRYLRITFLGDLRDLLVVFINPFAERLGLLAEQRFQRGLQLRAQSLGFLCIHVPRIAAP